MSKKKFKEKKSKKEKEQKGSIHNAVVKLLNENLGKTLDFKQIARKVGAKNNLANNEIFETLDSLLEAGRIRQLSNGGYASTKKSDSIVGKVDHVNPRFAYITTGIEGQKDIYVKTRDLGAAFHGDKVEVELLSKRTGENPEGRVTEIIERGRKRCSRCHERRADGEQQAQS